MRKDNKNNLALLNVNILFKKFVSHDMIKWIFTILLIFFIQPHSPKANDEKSVLNNSGITNSYKLANLPGLNKKLLEKLIIKMKDFSGLINKNIITVIDFTLPSTEKRLWTIDLSSGKILINCLVAHGKNSGDNFANSFSNKPESKQSSLGFYITEKTYFGKHGYSLKLKGLEKEINDKAFDRTIVVHSADYVSEEFIRKHGRLGRSFGCPAIPEEISKTFIDLVKEGSLLFIYHNSYN